MLKDEEIKDFIVNRTHNHNFEIGLEIIKRYIYDKKNEEVQINNPRTPIQFRLYHIAILKAIDFYKEQFKIE